MLHRTYRPQTLSEVCGQEQNLITIRAQIEEKRYSSAYLFEGHRGTGKTTIARILARTICCDHPTTDGPCNHCRNCRMILEEKTMDFIELDAASHNTIADIKELINSTSYLPSILPKKIYIIDEAHNLSKNAFDALLKTIEEPPEHCIFMLCTTELYKIPVTIRSRCSIFTFSALSIQTISGRLATVLDDVGKKYELKALDTIAYQADGSMRDALSLLDQCIAFYLGQTLTYDNVLEVLGAVDTDVFSQLLRSILSRDVAKVLDTVEELVMQGRELTQMAADFTWYLRNLLLVKTSDNIEDVLDVSTENMMQLKEEAQMIETDMLFRFIRVFSELSGQLKYATQKRVLLEVALIKLCVPAMETKADTLLDRIRVMEEKIEKGIPAGNMAEQTAYINADSRAADAHEVRQNSAELPKAIPEDVKEVVQNFRSIADEASGLLRNYLKKARLSLGGDNRLMIVMPGSLEAEFVGREDHIKELEALIENRIGKKVEVEVRHVEEGRHFEDTFVDIEQKINMEIIVED